MNPLLLPPPFPHWNHVAAREDPANPGRSAFRMQLWTRYGVLTRGGRRPARKRGSLNLTSLRPCEWTAGWKGPNLFISSSSLTSLGKLNDVSNYALQKPPSTRSQPPTVTLFFRWCVCHESLYALRVSWGYSCKNREERVGDLFVIRRISEFLVSCNSNVNYGICNDTNFIGRKFIIILRHLEYWINIIIFDYSDEKSRKIMIKMTCMSVIFTIINRVILSFSLVIISQSLYNEISIRRTNSCF